MVDLIMKRAEHVVDLLNQDPFLIIKNLPSLSVSMVTQT